MRSKTPTQDVNDQEDRARPASDMRGSGYPGYGDHHANHPHRGFYDDYRGYEHPHSQGGYPGGPPHGYDPLQRRGVNHYDPQYGRGDHAFRTDVLPPGEPKPREVRSRTPGPEFMRGTLADEDRYLQSRSRELRSKTPTAELQGSSFHNSNLSGTPDFIPASRYTSSSSSQHRGDSGYSGSSMQQPSDMVPYRHHNNTSHHHTNRPLSGPDFSGVGGPGGYPGAPRSQTYAGSLSYAAGGGAPPRNYENTSMQGYGYPDRGLRKQSTSFEHEEPAPSSLTRVARDGWGASDSPGSSLNRSRSPTRFGGDDMGSYSEMTVQLKRQENGFGFRIIGGTEEGSQVSRLSLLKRHVGVDGCSLGGGGKGTG